MNIDFLASKLRVPQINPDIIQRPRLTRQMAEAVRYKLTLIAAPAGYGKTTLLCEFLRNKEIPCAWISLDKEDDNPVRFWQSILS